MTASDYIAQIFAPTDRVAIYLQKRGVPVNGKRPPLGPIQRRLITAQTAAAEPFQRFLRAHNAQGSDVWIGMNPLFPSAQSRTKDSIAAIRRIYLDLDHDADTSLNQILTSSQVPQPNYVLTSSPHHYQIIWNVTDFDQPAAETTMRALAHIYHADPAATDITRILRLPGLHNKKYPTTFLITAQRLSTRIHQPADFHVDSSPPPPATHNSLSAPSSPRSMGPDTTPSGRDFGFCCRSIWLAYHHHHDVDAVCAQLTSELEQRGLSRHKSPSTAKNYALVTVKKARLKIENQRNLSL